jgi:hypothetical protein
LRNPGRTAKNGVSSFVFIAERIGPEVCSAQNQDGKKVGAFITLVDIIFVSFHAGDLEMWLINYPMTLSSFRCCTLLPSSVQFFFLKARL